MRKASFKFRAHRLCRLLEANKTNKTLKTSKSVEKSALIIHFLSLFCCVSGRRGKNNRNDGDDDIIFILLPSFIHSLTHFTHFMLRLTEEQEEEEVLTTTTTTMLMKMKISLAISHSLIHLSTRSIA